jgi:hypothetical protein
VTKKFAFPKLNFNNGHNMWANRDQGLVYNTEWFGNRLIAFSRKTGKLVSVLEVGADPAHVMTRTDTDQVQTTLNGEDAVIEASPGASGIDPRIPLQQPGEPATHPHAHWMSSDGTQMATPNANSDDSTLINVPNGTVTSKLDTGLLPIAAYLTRDDPGTGSSGSFGERASALVGSFKRDLYRNRSVLHEIQRELVSREQRLTEVRILDLLIWSVSAAT